MWHICRKRPERPFFVTTGTILVSADVSVNLDKLLDSISEFILYLRDKDGQCFITNSAYRSHSLGMEGILRFDIPVRRRFQQLVKVNAK